jgi:hypothetical protein
VLRRRWGRIGFARIARALGRIAVASAVMTAAILAAWRWLWPMTGRLWPALAGDWASHTLAAVSLLVVTVPIGIAAFLLTARMMGSEELHELRKPKAPID